MGQSVGVVVAFSAGLLSFLSPCVLPLFPSYLSFITGMSVADLTGEIAPSARRRILLHALTFVVGLLAGVHRAGRDLQRGRTVLARPS